MNSQQNVLGKTPVQLTSRELSAMFDARDSVHASPGFVSEVGALKTAIAYLLKEHYGAEADISAEIARFNGLILAYEDEEIEYANRLCEAVYMAARREGLRLGLRLANSMAGALVNDDAADALARKLGEPCAGECLQPNQAEGKTNA